MEGSVKVKEKEISNYNAIQLTNDNLDEIAEEICGEVFGKSVMRGRNFVANVGDWILEDSEGRLEVYTDKSFRKDFIEIN